MAAFGATGAGKTEWVLQTLSVINAPRLLVWDHKHDHTLQEVGQGFKVWADFVNACRGKTFKARYLPNHRGDLAAQFEAFCSLAWHLGNAVVFVDELPEVTKANRAPLTWRTIVNVGRSYDDGSKSLSVIGAGQRPAEVDKSFLANCDVIHTGRLGDIQDAKRFAGSWGVEPSELVNLPNLHWLEKRASDPQIFRGVLQYGYRKSSRKTKPKGAP